MKRLASSARDWLLNAGLEVPPFVTDDDQAAPWVEACHYALAATDRGEHRTEWRAFIALLARDDAQRAAVSAAYARSPREGAAEALRAFHGFVQRLSGARIVPRLLKLQELRKRRLSGRSTGVAPMGIARPADSAYDAELVRVIGRPRKKDR